MIFSLCLHYASDDIQYSSATLSVMNFQIYKCVEILSWTYVKYSGTTPPKWHTSIQGEKSLLTQINSSVTGPEWPLLDRNIALQWKHSVSYSFSMSLPVLLRLEAMHQRILMQRKLRLVQPFGRRSLQQLVSQLSEWTTQLNITHSKQTSTQIERTTQPSVTQPYNNYLGWCDT